jgi:hypothetical protein
MAESRCRWVRQSESRIPIQHQLTSMRTVRHLRPCTKGYLPSNEVELLGGSGQFVPELRMTEADQRIGALGRG